MNVLITGAHGFIGKNLQANLDLMPEIRVLAFTATDTIEHLRKLLAKADIVVHLAGINRPSNPSEFETGNAEFTRILCNEIEKTGRNISVVLTSSIHAVLENPYGKSKKAAEEAVFSYARRTGAAVYVYRLPGVFGKWCKPNYNSVVSTFCYNTAHNQTLRIDNPVHEITLVYIDDVVEELILVLKEKVAPNANNFLTVQPEYRISLSGLADTLKKFHESRIGLLHNYDRSDPFVAKLYATYLSYLPQENLAISADMKHDDRGFFAELIKSSCFGQISVSRTRPGISRGSHWHNTKVEKFIVIEGEAVIKFRKIGDSEVFEYAVSGKNIQIIDIPPGYTHSITNVGSQDVLTIFWAGELFDPDKPDTYYQEV